MHRIQKNLLAIAVLLITATAALAQTGLRLENYPYPFPVHDFPLMTQGDNLEMSYMDVPARTNEIGVIVLLHGKNFSGAYWGETARALSDLNYRVIIPDQLGFGKSSKPHHYQFTFDQLALNTHILLEHIGVTNASVFGHSMGGMLAVRYALTYPEATQNLLLVDPLGLEDWREKGVPYVTVDFSYEKEMKQSDFKIREYEESNYYHGTWKSEFNPMVEMLDQFFQAPEYPAMAWDQALTSDMIFTQPVCHEFANLKMPVLLIVGAEDHTAIGKDLVSKEKAAQLGHYPELARQAAAQMKNATLIEISHVGHLPQIEAFPQFITSVKDFLRAHPPALTSTNSNP